MNETLISLFPLILIFVVFYFLLIRPQQRKIKELDVMRNNLKRGDEVVTSAGIYCKIIKFKDKPIPNSDKKTEIVEVSISNGININIEKSSILGLVNNPETEKNKE